MEFKGKVAVITGGAQGIGRCIAEEFRKQGAFPVLGEGGLHQRGGQLR